jgi:trimeric autotransporter adhesin
VNGASFLSEPVAPGEIVTIFGTGFGPPVLQPLRLINSNRVAPELGWVRVLFDGIPAPLVYVIENQVSAIVPYAVAGKASTEIRIEYHGNRSRAATVPVAPASPAIFTSNASGRGAGAIHNSDFRINSRAHPARTGTIVAIFMTGAGQTVPAGIDGQVAGADLSRPVLAPSARIGGLPAEVLSATTSPGTISALLQVNVRIPSGISRGDAVPVEVSFGAFTTQQGVTMAIQ